MKYKKGFGTVGILIAVLVVIGLGFVVYNAGKNSANVAPSGNTSTNTPGATEYFPPVDNGPTTACNKNSTPSITITNPKGGETYTVGQRVNITWTSCNVEKVFLGWGQGGHDGGLFSETPTLASLGTYQWTVPNYSDIDGSVHWISVSQAVPLPNNQWTTGVFAKSGGITIKTKPTTVNLSTFSSQYIAPYPGQWPPVIKNSSTVYSCVATGHTGDGPDGSTIPQVINGKTYCITNLSDGGAGHWAGEYTYTTANGSGTKTTSFRVDWPNCGGYGTTGDPQYDQCKKDQSTFFNNLDAYIASLM